MSQRSLLDAHQQPCQRIRNKKAADMNQQLLLYKEVELEGFEPSSAQGNHTLSTRLFQPLVFVTWQDLDHQPCPYPLKFHTCNEACKSYFRFTCTA